MSLDSIQQSISSLLNPKFEQCRFITNITQWLAKNKKRNVKFSLVYHIQNFGEYAIFIFKDNSECKLIECIPLKKYHFFMKLKYNNNNNNNNNILSNLFRIEILQITNEGEKKYFEFELNNDLQFLQFIYTMIKVVDHICKAKYKKSNEEQIITMESGPEKVYFNDIFEIPSELLTKMKGFNSIMNSNKKNEVLQLPISLFLMTSSVSYELQLRKRENYLQLSQQKETLIQQLNNMKNQQSQQGNKRLSVNLNNNNSLHKDIYKNPQQTRKGSGNGANNVKKAKNKKTVGNDPFDWCLYYMEKYELDENEVVFINPLYESFGVAAGLDNLNKKKAKEDLETIKVIQKTRENLQDMDDSIVEVDIEEEPKLHDYGWLLIESERKKRMQELMKESTPVAEKKAAVTVQTSIVEKKLEEELEEVEEEVIEEYVEEEEEIDEEEELDLSEDEDDKNVSLSKGTKPSLLTVTSTITSTTDNKQTNQEEEEDEDSISISISSSDGEGGDEEEDDEGSIDLSSDDDDL
ncbi:hypothetical protein ABK040_004698 [Willaertia magna]